MVDGRETKISELKYLTLRVSRDMTDEHERSPHVQIEVHMRMHRTFRVFGSALG